MNLNISHPRRDKRKGCSSANRSQLSDPNSEAPNRPKRSTQAGASRIEQQTRTVTVHIEPLTKFNRDSEPDLRPAAPSRVSQNELQAKIAKLKARAAQVAAQKAAAAVETKEADELKEREFEMLGKRKDAGDQAPSNKRSKDIVSDALGKAMYGENSTQLAKPVEGLRSKMDSDEIAEFLNLDNKVSPASRKKKCFLFADQLPGHRNQCKVAEVNTLLFRLAGNSSNFIGYLHNPKGEKETIIERLIMRFNEADKERGDAPGTTFRQLVGHDIVGICETKASDSPTDRALLQNDKPKAKNDQLLVYKTGQEDQEPKTPQNSKPQAPVTKFSDYSKFCSKSMVWSDRPAWQDYARLLCCESNTLPNGNDKIQDLHKFVKDMAEIHSSPVFEQLMEPAEGSVWPKYTPVHSEALKALASKGLVKARDLVNGAEMVGTTNPIKFVYDLFRRMYLQSKGKHCQLDGEQFLSFLGRNLQNYVTDGFKYCDAFDDCTIRDFLPGHAAQLVEAMGYDNPHSLLAELSRAAVIDGTDRGDSAAAHVAKMWPMLMWVSCRIIKVNIMVIFPSGEHFALRNNASRDCMTQYVFTDGVSLTALQENVKLDSTVQRVQYPEYVPIGAKKILRITSLPPDPESSDITTPGKPILRKSEPQAIRAATSKPPQTKKNSTGNLLPGPKSKTKAKGTPATAAKPAPPPDKSAADDELESFLEDVIQVGWSGTKNSTKPEACTTKGTSATTTATTSISKAWLKYNLAETENSKQAAKLLPPEFIDSLIEAHSKWCSIMALPGLQEEDIVSDRYGLLATPVTYSTKSKGEVHGWAVLMPASMNTSEGDTAIGKGYATSDLASNPSFFRRIFLFFDPKRKLEAGALRCVDPDSVPYNMDDMIPPSDIDPDHDPIEIEGEIFPLIPVYDNSYSNYSNKWQSKWPAKEKKDEGEDRERYFDYRADFYLKIPCLNFLTMIAVEVCRSVLEVVPLFPQYFPKEYDRAKCETTKKIMVYDPQCGRFDRTMKSFRATGAKFLSFLGVDQTVLWRKLGDGNWKPVGQPTINGFNTMYECLNSFFCLWGLMSSTLSQLEALRAFLKNSFCLIAAVTLRNSPEVDKELKKLKSEGIIRIFSCRLPHGAIVQAGENTHSKVSHTFYIFVRSIVLKTLAIAKVSPVKPPIFAPVYAPQRPSVKRPSAPHKPLARHDAPRGESSAPKRIRFASPIATVVNDTTPLDLLADLTGAALFPQSPTSSSMAVKGSPLIITSLEEFDDNINSWAENGDFKDVSQDLAFHEQALQHQNSDLENTLLRLQQEAEARDDKDQESEPEPGNEDKGEANQEIYKLQAQKSQLNIAIAEQRQQELHRLIEELCPTRQAPPN